MPAWMADQFDGLDDDPATRKLVAASIAAEQCRTLQTAGVDEFHFYTLNRADLTFRDLPHPRLAQGRSRPPAQSSRSKPEKRDRRTAMAANEATIDRQLPSCLKSL